MELKIKDRRFLGADGLMYHFCKECQDYLPVTEFNNCTSCPFGKYPLCKHHHRERNKVSYHKNKNQETKPRKKNDMAYLSITFPTDDDYKGSKQLLQALGYDTSKSIHQQFLARIRDKYNVEI